MTMDFSRFEGEPWFQHDTEMRSPEATTALGQKLQDKVKCPIVPGATYEYLDDATPANLEREDIQVGPSLGFLYRDPARDAAAAKIVLYIHGGAFICGNGNYARFVGFNVSNKLGLPVLTVEYRLAPEHKLPAGLDDVHGFYKYLIEQRGYQPDDIVVMGDSAGGEMALALAIRLIRLGRPTPHKVIALHPAVDVYSDTVNIRHGLVSHRDNIDTDQIFLGGLAPALHDMLLPGTALDDDPEVSPICFDQPEKFPPTLIVADDTEILLCDGLLFGEKLAKAGVDVKVHIFHYMWHDFQVFFPDIPESEVVWRECREFLGL
ncbi:MAG: alpha/beta hydrolase [Propionibacteriaceae bacterium]|nr:alpha/beta hydrolase [Propionibacteriaceae bacterium]